MCHIASEKFKGLRSSGGEIAERASENSWLAIPRPKQYPVPWGAQP